MTQYLITEIIRYPNYQKWLSAMLVKFYGIVPEGTGQLVNQCALRRGELDYGKSNAQSGEKPVQIMETTNTSRTAYTLGQCLS